MSDITLEISISADNDGYCLLQCPTCGEIFKIQPSDFEDDGVLDVFCPACGLAGENYITDDVVELAKSMARNYANELIYNEFKKMERSFKGGNVTFKAGKEPRPEPENPIHSGVEALVVTHFPCCKRSVKVKPLLQITGCYCSFCGVKNYEVE